MKNLTHRIPTINRLVPELDVNRNHIPHPTAQHEAEQWRMGMGRNRLYLKGERRSHPRERLCVRPSSKCWLSARSRSRFRPRRSQHDSPSESWFKFRQVGVGVGIKKENVHSPREIHIIHTNDLFMYISKCSQMNSTPFHLDRSTSSSGSYRDFE
jgi:hypothetical protein